MSIAIKLTPIEGLGPGFFECEVPQGTQPIGQPSPPPPDWRAKGDKLAKAAREMIELVGLFDEDQLLALDNDPHPPSAISVYADSLERALKEYESARGTP